MLFVTNAGGSAAVTSAPCAGLHPGVPDDAGTWLSIRPTSHAAATALQLVSAAWSVPAEHAAAEPPPATCKEIAALVAILADEAFKHAGSC